MIWQHGRIQMSANRCWFAVLARSFDYFAEVDLNERSDLHYLFDGIYSPQEIAVCFQCTFKSPKSMVAPFCSWISQELYAEHEDISTIQRSCKRHPHIDGEFRFVRRCAYISSLRHQKHNDNDTSEALNGQNRTSSFVLQSQVWEVGDVANILRICDRSECEKGKH